jgi:hypothetical protein
VEAPSCLRLRHSWRAHVCSKALTKRLTRVLGEQQHWPPAAAPNSSLVKAGKLQATLESVAEEHGFEDDDYDAPVNFAASNFQNELRGWSRQQLIELATSQSADEGCEQIAVLKYRQKAMTAVSRAHSMETQPHHLRAFENLRKKLEPSCQLPP